MVTDGYTLLVNTSAQAYSASLLKNLPYDPLNDFIPVAPLTFKFSVFHQPPAILSRF
jgi:tripartite-type tricarboxylate transporter receptor subunit TctC